MKIRSYFRCDGPGTQTEYNKTNDGKTEVLAGGMGGINGRVTVKDAAEAATHA